jgi:serine phosphatase RsbU (regulator of sigma subunit)
MERELALAGEVQANFLPRRVPDLPGWQLSIALEPARETSGDFYDVNLLPDGRLGILVADVVGKGVGAALFMALSWILFRTYAAEYPARPEQVLSAVNRRILEDTNAKQFVTVFYGILDPTTGTLVYANAGHCPSYIASTKQGKNVLRLIRTGLPLGIFADITWERRTVRLDPGDVLVLYTDGITEAESVQETFYGEERLLESVRANLGRPAREIRDAIMADLRRFVGDAPNVQRDDIALAVVVRD